MLKYFQSFLLLDTLTFSLHFDSTLPGFALQARGEVLRVQGGYRAVLLQRELQPHIRRVSLTMGQRQSSQAHGIHGQLSKRETLSNWR